MSTQCTSTAWQYALSITLLVSSAAGCTQRQTDQSFLSEAVKYERSGDSKAAIIQFKNALQKSPQNMEARQLLAALYLKSGDALSAEKEIRKAIEGGFAIDNGWPILAKSLLMQGQFQRVIDEAPASAARNAKALVLRGDAYLGLEKMDEAMDSYEQALKQKEGFSSAFTGRARIHAARRNFAAADADIGKALAANEKDVDAWLFKGNLLRIEGKPEPALAAYSRAVAVDPDNIDAALAKVYTELSLGKFDEAQNSNKAVRKLAPNTLAAFHSQALIDYLQGRPKLALDSVQQVLRAAPQHGPTLLLAGLIQKELGAMQQAEDYLQRYLDKEPHNLYATGQLISVLLKNGNVQHADSLLESSLQRAPNDTQLLALAGQVNLQRKNYAKAVAYFERATALAPNEAKLQTALGASKMAQGDLSGAIDILEKATQSNKNSLEANLLLVRSRVAAKQYDAALVALKKLQSDYPDNPVIPNLVGQVYLQLKDVKNARAAFGQALALLPSFSPAAAQLAQLDIQEGKSDAARQRFLSILEHEKTSVHAMIGLSELAAAQGKSSEAIEWLEKAHQANPKDLQPASLLAMQYVRTGNNDKASTLAKAFAVAQPDSATALELLARVQILSKDKDGALGSLSKLANLSPNPADVQLRIALLQMSSREYRAAQEAVNKALALKPDLAQARYVDGMLKIAQRDMDTARTIARNLQKDQPRAVQGYLLEAEVAGARNNPAAAASAMETAFKLEPSSALLIKFHHWLEAAARSKEADSRANEWLKVYPDDKAVRLLVAQTSLSRRQYKNAIAQYETLLRADGANVAVLNNLAIAYHAEKDPRALETAEKAYKIAANNAAVLDTLGWILVQRGDAARGLPMLRKASTLLPASREIQAHLEQALHGSVVAQDAAVGAKRESKNGL